MDADPSIHHVPEAAGNVANQGLSSGRLAPLTPEGELSISEPLGELVDKRWQCRRMIRIGAIRALGIGRSGQVSANIFPIRERFSLLTDAEKCQLCD
jgi:hypothetical protein